MKIGEFAARNNVTAKMLRHYDEQDSGAIRNLIEDSTETINEARNMGPNSVTIKAYP
ncbi:MerR family transcriptional regulator [Paenibacillus arenilitoris]|uniref:HTH merR-type domain-containing protein n=1 Tax=Paenibacillus arenilitoris TaxID=2772299 RepID=A0A927H580_9BACL|nr:hypothetical protein [Paenibacillus arenilitoris]MBD2867274.1 hypothetical protein [Paenibacillus arenilitoris]